MGQRAQQSLCHITHIDGPLPEIAIFHGHELADEAFTDSPHGRRRTPPLANYFSLNLLNVGRIRQQMLIDLEDGHRILTDRLLKAQRRGIQIQLHLQHRLVEQLQLQLRVVTALGHHLLQLHLRAPDPGSGDRDASRSCDTFEAPSPLLVGMQHPLHFGMQNTGSQLSSQRYQERFIALVKLPRISLLHHQHTEDLALLHDWHAEKRIEIIFGDFG